MDAFHDYFGTFAYRSAIGTNTGSKPEQKTNTQRFDVWSFDGDAYVIPPKTDAADVLKVATALKVAALPLGTDLAADPVNLPPGVVAQGHPKLPVDSYVKTTSGFARLSAVLLAEFGVGVAGAVAAPIAKGSKPKKMKATVEMVDGKMVLSPKDTSTPKMHVIWDGTEFVATASPDKFPPESSAGEVPGKVVGGKFSCEFGNLEIK